jgi:hypothetical protein
MDTSTIHATRVLNNEGPLRGTADRLAVPRITSGGRAVQNTANCSLASRQHKNTLVLRSPHENNVNKRSHTLLNIDEITSRPERSTSAIENLMERIADAIAVRVERITGTRQRLMDVEDAAAYLGMTPHALRHKAGVDVPSIRLDGKLRFDKRDLDVCIDRAKRNGV